MLLQSYRGFVQVIPAIPEAWADGMFRGLCARGGFEVDATWREGKVTEVRVLSKAGGKLRLLNPFGGPEVKVTGARLEADSLREPVIELDTLPGQVIRFSVEAGSLTSRAAGHK
jgi:alpha-L-fucosidase 2